MTEAMTPAVFVDRDGVLNRDRPRSVRRLEELEPLPGAAEAVAMLNRAGLRVVIATNQSIIGRGDVPRATVEDINAALLRHIEAAGGSIEAVALCPHAPDDDCACRKPMPGLLQEAAEANGIDLEASWFVGDKLTDVEAARAAGCTPVLVRSGATLEQPPAGVAIFDDLREFAEHLLASQAMAVTDRKHAR